MQKWEYIIIRETISPLIGGIYYTLPNGNETKYSGSQDSHKKLHILLNEFGDNGFELIETATSATNAGLYSRMWILKRPKA